MSIALTIFTPTYNREYTLRRLYNSLLNQSVHDFEWLVVDDGSTDNTEELMKQFVSDNSIKIRYYKIVNGGKHRAINIGVEKAEGELFFIVDSDDWLLPDSIECVLYHFSNIRSDNSFAGVVGMRVYESGMRIGGDINFDILDCSYTELRFIKKIKGDMAEVLRTNVLKMFPFPEIDGERFCPEALIWNRIACMYKMRYFCEKIYVCEYLPDGLTAKIIKLRMQSPEASLVYYSELKRLSIPFVQKIKSIINYWRFSYCSKRSFLLKVRQISWETVWLMPLGYVFHLKDRLYENTSSH